MVAGFFTHLGWGTPRQDDAGTGLRRWTDDSEFFRSDFPAVYRFRYFQRDVGPCEDPFSRKLLDVEWILGNGIDLSGLGDETVDFAFSYIVLQHMPEPSFAVRYIREMLRVLKPGGMFLFQFNSVPRMTMNWKGRLAWRIVDLPWTLGFRQVSRGVASLLGLPPDIAGKSWRGASLDSKVVRETIETAGAVVKEMVGEKTPMTWCCGLKSMTNP